MAIRDNKEYIRILVYSYYTTITGVGGQSKFYERFAWVKGTCTVVDLLKEWGFLVVPGFVEVAAIHFGTPPAQTEALIQQVTETLTSYTLNPKHFGPPKPKAVTPHKLHTQTPQTEHLAQQQ